MSETKLVKYLQRPVAPVNDSLNYTPVILSDSKGFCLRNQITNPVDRHIKWWCKSGSKVQDSYSWLNNNIHSRIKNIGKIHIYIWLGTCNLTTKCKKKITLNSQGDQTVDYIVQYFNKFIELLNQYPSSKLTFLEVPVYSIKGYNKSTDDNLNQEYKTLDKELERQIFVLNGHIRQLNTQLNASSPNFSIHLKVSSKRRTRSRTETVHYFNYSLYSDGIHPKQNLALVWLREISERIKTDCWS